MSVSPQAVAAFIVAELDEPLREAGLDPRDVGDDFDLLTTDIVDSLGMMELIMALNERFALDVDFEGLDPEEFTVLGPLARHVAQASAPVRRTREWIEREYGREKWPAIERVIEKEYGEEPDAGLARLLGRVAGSQWRDGDALAVRQFAAGRGAVELPLAGAHGAAQGIILDVVADACTERTDLIAELGAGWGWHILTLWAKGGPRQASYVAAEYTAAGRRAAARLGGLDPRLRFSAVPFDYNAPSLDGGGARHAVVFSVHSIEQIPYVTPSVFDAIRGLAPRVTCVHFEPVGWQVEGHDRSGSSSAYAEHHDYNRNLVAAVRAEAAAGRLVLDALVPDLFGVNASNATTVIRWRSEAE
jgi:acyl carrier protein